MSRSTHRCILTLAALLCLLSTVPGSNQQIISTTANTTNRTTNVVDDPLYLYDLAGEIAVNDIGQSCTRVQVDAACRNGPSERNLSNAVVLILLDAYGGSCTGTLINAPSGRPTVLTAFHCMQDLMIEVNIPAESVPLPFNNTDPEGQYVNDPFTFSESVASLFMFVFDWGRNCTNTTGFVTTPSSPPRFAKMLQGAIPIYGNAASDIMLLELLDDIPAAFEPYYMGWTSDPTETPSSLIVMHHPSGDFKKVAATNGSPKTVSSKDITVSVEAKGEGNYWYVPSWDLGTMEPGSSGSALVDAANNTIVGTLTGSPSSGGCSSQVPVVFAKLATAWQLYGLWEALGGSGPNQPMRMPGMRPKLQRLQLQIAPDVVMVKDRLSAPRTELIAFKVTGAFQPGEQVRIDLNLTSSSMNASELSAIVGRLRNNTVIISRNNTYVNVSLDVGPANVTSAVFKTFRIDVKMASTTDSGLSEQRGLVGIAGPSRTAGYSYRDPILITRLPLKYSIPDIRTYAYPIDNLCTLLKTQEMQRATFSPCANTSATSASATTPSGRRLLQSGTAAGSNDALTDIVTSLLGPILGVGTLPTTGTTVPTTGTTVPTTVPKTANTTVPNTTFPSTNITTTFPTTVPTTSVTTPSKSTPRGPTGLVFAYTPTNDVTVDISTCPDSSIDTFLFLIDAGISAINTSSQKLIAYNDDAGPRVTCSTISDSTLKAGKTYYIVVSQNNAYITTKQGAEPVMLTINPKTKSS